MNQWISGKQSQKGNYIEKEKMEPVILCAFCDDGSHVTSVRRQQKECRKRRRRNDHGVFMEYKAV